MNTNSHHGQRLSVRTRRRGSALYIAVLSTAMIVSLLGLAGLTVVRVERRQAAGATDLLVARANARSAVEMALVELGNSTDWRTTYASGVETARRSLGTLASGTCSWILTDTDGDLAVPDTQLRLLGIGRVGETVQVASVEVNLGVSAELRSQVDDSSRSDDKLEAGKWWCQYFKPNLPVSAVGWKVTSIELYCGRDKREIFEVVLYQPDGSNMPSGTVVDSITVDSSDLNRTVAWNTFTFSGDDAVDSAEGLCLALTTTASNPPLDIPYQGGGVTQADSALIQGNPGWSTYEVDKALIYRIHGVYFLEYGDVKAVMGTWLWEAAP